MDDEVVLLELLEILSPSATRSIYCAASLSIESDIRDFRNLRVSVISKRLSHRVRVRFEPINGVKAH